MKKLFGENGVEAVLQRLDRLTQDEARTAAAQALEVVYGLAQNMRTVINGKKIRYRLSFAGCGASFPLDGEASADGIRNALGTFFDNNKLLGFNSVLEILHELTSEMNKAKREIFHGCVNADGNH